MHPICLMTGRWPIFLVGQQQAQGVQANICLDKPPRGKSAESNHMYIKVRVATLRAKVRATTEFAQKAQKFAHQNAFSLCTLEDSFITCSVTWRCSFSPMSRNSKGWRRSWWQMTMPNGWLSMRLLLRKLLCACTDRLSSDAAIALIVATSSPFS